MIYLIRISVQEYWRDGVLIQRSATQYKGSLPYIIIHHINQSSCSHAVVREAGSNMANEQKLPKSL